ncbi:MAG: sugar phosphate isomerase/epimerase [Spirochaetaceae bacterium]|nr:sugar phosphate isomerase/epimerase [Spirochaetaceae bacterium]
MNPVIGINLPNGSYDSDATRRYLSIFKENGFDAVEVCLDTYPLIIDGAICEPWVEYIGRMLKEFPFKYSAHIGRGLDLRDLKNKEKHRTVLKSSIDLCARLGLSPLVLHYEVKGRNQEAEQYFIDAHKETAKYAEQKGVLIVVENIEVELVDPVVELVAAIDMPNLRMAFDTGHAFLASRYFKFDFIEAFKKTLPYLAHLHLSDNTGTFEELRITDRPKYDALPMGYRIEYSRGDIHLPPYFGKIPYDEFFSLLGDYKGMFLCEYYVERFLPFGELVQCRVRKGVLEGRKKA